MTPAQAADLATRTLAAIASPMHGTGTIDTRAADRERVASDLAGLRECYAISTTLNGTVRMRESTANHARRYADGLRRTAALYGVTE